MTFVSRCFGRRASAAALALGLFCLLIAGCGGGGGGGSGVNLGTVTTSTTTMGSGSGTGSSSGSGSATPPAASNVAAIVVDAGPASSTQPQVNIPYVSVTVCAPGSTTNCATIDHVIVDSGSEGLRLMASALPIKPTAFTQVVDGTGVPYAECAQFAEGYAWGSVKLADVTIGGETASALPIQVIADPNFNSTPSTCSSSGPSVNTIAALGGKGLLGVSVFRQDCGSACATAAIPGAYYTCQSAGSNCTSSTITTTQQVANPVASFPVDNNGVVIELPAIPASGATNVAGSLVFGIGTQGNNALGNAKAYGVNPATGDFSTVINGVGYSGSFIDSGSNFIYFDTSSMPVCTTAGFAGFYCPLTTATFSGTAVGTNGTTGSFAFNIGNAATLYNANLAATAFNDIAAGLGQGGGFDFGLPFFYGRTIFTAIEGASTPGGTGPYVGF